MNTNKIIQDYITENLLQGENAYPLCEAYDLIESGIIDSFGIMSLLMFIEEKFSLTISNDDLMPENFSSISAISTLVDRQRTT